MSPLRGILLVNLLVTEKMVKLAHADALDGQERIRREAATKEREARIQRERAERQAKLDGVQQDFLSQKETVGM